MKPNVKNYNWRSQFPILAYRFKVLTEIDRIILAAKYKHATATLNVSDQMR